MRLENKVAIVTGAAQGVGRGVALAFAKEGAKVAILDLNKEQIAITVNEFKELGFEAIGVSCNVAKRDEVQAAVKETVDTFGTVDILVNNAQASRNKPFEETTEEDMALAYDTGVKSVYYFMQEVFPIFKEKNKGKIINFASGAGIAGQLNQGSYAAAKEAVRGLTRVVANEWGKYGINVNIISPFANSPGMIAWSQAYPEAYENSIGKVPLRRVGDCEMDIGRSAVYLASADSDYVTGQTLMVDGGSVHVR